MKLQGKTALVTGGGTGMGRAICELFATEGARVAVNYRASREAAEDVVRAIVARGGDAFAIQADVANEADVKRMIAEVDSRWGRLDVLVNNAGWTKFAPDFVPGRYIEMGHDEPIHSFFRIVAGRGGARVSA